MDGVGKSFRMMMARAKSRSARPRQRPKGKAKQGTHTTHKTLCDDLYEKLVDVTRIGTVQL